MRLYRLGDLVAPEPAPDGTGRIATDADAKLAADWFTAFAEEVRDAGAGEDHAVAVRDKLSHQASCCGRPAGDRCPWRALPGRSWA